MVGRPQKRTRETREKILAEATRLFSGQGFEATSVDAVAEAAGVAKATVFAHFADKTSLLIAARTSDLEELEAAMRAHVARAPLGETRDYIAGIFHPWLALYRSDPDFARLYLVQTTLRDGPWTRLFLDVCQAMEDCTRDAFARLSREGRLAPGADPDLLAEGVLAFFYHMIVGHSLGALPGEAEQTARFDGLLATWLAAGASG
ncbi:TetR/AcrR family transcriptional regulator [Stappia indica]|jgi:AcrR family transcriptional regulator|uniref:TetR family transcriptional regulator n=1 Tax=Stappia indica TaxID=538381 RepID=A0A857C934_9HYPH|nr:TetR/AcrR family transcriptional regulator [Stappia indica]QGZ35012.1 TetR family transcriptional regulator [Stappia indica]